MKILHVYKDYPPVLGGIEGHLRLVAESQVRRGHQVTVLVTARGPRTSAREEAGVEVVRAARLATVASTPLSPTLWRELRRRRPDVAHLHFPYPPGELAQLLGGRSRATVVTYHSDVVRQRLLGRLYRPLMVRLLARADRILVTSPGYAAGSPVLARFAGKLRVVPLGVDTARFARPDRERVDALRERFPGPRVLFVGRLRYYKALDVLVAAVERLDASLLVVGRGPMEKPWRRLARASPAAARIHFLGDVDDDALPALYAAADVFALPSDRRSEAFGLGLAEAMAAGVPVVSTEIGTGTSFVNRDGETGLVVPPRDAEALAAALGRLLGDADLRREMGRQAQRRAIRELDAERMLERIDDVYAEVLASR
jgi:rhamnosyl/mannosyltransferase